MTWGATAAGVWVPHREMQCDTARLIKEGDPESGWRGDPTFRLLACNETEEIQVWGLDRKGDAYKVTAVPAFVGDRFSITGRRPNVRWRQQILLNLRRGDWQNPNAVTDMLDARRRVEERQKKERKEKSDELAEKVAWGLRRDLGHHAGVTSRRFFAVDGSRKAS